MADHPVKVPPELVASLRNSAPHGIRDAGVTRELWLIDHAYAAGADQELEACCEYLQSEIGPLEAAHFRAAMRPKPPTLAEQGCDALDAYIYGNPDHGDKQNTYNAIRAALTRLAELEAQQ